MWRWLFDRSWQRRNTNGVPGVLESAQFILHQNKRYRATITLTGIETWAGNSMIEDKFRALGFKDPKVTGSGGLRQGEALWAGQDQSVSLPLDPHISDVTEIV